MHAQHIIPSCGFSTMIAEDVAAPELRNPKAGQLRLRGGIRRIFEKLAARVA